MAALWNPTVGMPNRTASSVASAQEIIAVMGLERQLADLLSDGKRPSGMSEYEAARVYQKAMAVKIALEMWEAEGKQALAMDERVIDRISTASSSKINPLAFRALPYIDPMVVFPVPIRVDSANHGDTMHLLGFVITATTSLPNGRRGTDPGEFCHSNDPDAAGLRLTFLFRVVEADGQQSYEFDYFTIDLGDDPYTMKECLERIVRRFSFDPDTTDGSDQRRRRFLRQAAEIGVSALLYLCSTVLDVERIPPKAVARATVGKKPRQPLSVYRVGWKVGAALSRYAKQVRWSDDPSQQGGPTHEQDPQHRKAHIKTVWTGPGSHVPKIAYVEPYWTHKEKLDGYAVNTARKVV